jgi:hypothetical protein
MLVPISQKKVQYFLRANFGERKRFPKFGSSSHVVLGDFLLGWHDYCVFEADREVFLKVMKGRGVHFGLSSWLGKTL